jgi:hypothetical protein
MGATLMLPFTATGPTFGEMVQLSASVQFQLKVAD